RHRFQRDNEVIESFGTLGSNAFNWNTNVPAGSVITLALIDAIQQFVLSAPFTVLQGCAFLPLSVMKDSTS
ncbi:hypothetical protein C2E23DRAFT_743390, partial [Lenzites betulinus]